jgi:uncharacterized protein
MIQRVGHLHTLESLLKRFPVVAIIGARQVGKTTLARQLAQRHRTATTFFDLEDVGDRSRLSDPRLALAPLRGLIVLDEVQRQPDVFSLLRVLADRPRRPARFLVLGSASPGLLRQSSESLAGRIAYHELAGFSLSEVGVANLDRLWIRGGFPLAFLARNDKASADWRRRFIRTYLERDLPQMGLTIPSATLDRFWQMLAHYHGQIWNGSEFARSFGVADTTVRRYVEVLASTFMVRLLRPWAENIGKRQVKSPKVFLSDSGILHALLNLESKRDVEGHPKLGASWEGFILNQVIEQLGARPEECYFWATHAGAELDLLIVRGRRRLGFEIKRTSAPRVTPSMRAAMSDLGLSRLEVIHAGTETYPLAKGMRAVAAGRILADIARL